VRVTLAPGGSCGGPVTVSAVNDRRPLGAWAVSPGTGEARFCRIDAGEVTVTWQLPGGEPKKKTVTLEDKRIRLVITDRSEPPKFSAPVAAAVRKLMGDLGSDDYETREAASRALAAMGDAVRAEIEPATRSRDPEVRCRAQDLLEALSQEEVEIRVF
jgi:hypothetical protein